MDSDKIEQFWKRNLREKIMAISKGDHVNGKFGSAAMKQKNPNEGVDMQDIILYSDFANRLLNKTSDKDYNRRYNAYRRKQHPKKMADFYQRMEQDTNNRKNNKFSNK